MNYSSVININVLFCIHQTCTQNLFFKGLYNQQVSRNSPKVTQIITNYLADLPDN